MGREYARTFSLTDLSLRPEGRNPWAIAKYSQERFDVLDLASGNVQVHNVNKKLSIPNYHPCFNQYAQVYRAESEQIEDIKLSCLI